MASRDNRDTLLAFYGSYDERSDPSVSEHPLPDVTEALQQTTTTTSANNSPSNSPSKSAATQPTPEPSAGHRQPSQYQPGSRAKSFVGSKQQTASSASPQQPADSGSVFPSALQAGKPKSPGNAPPSYTNPFTDPPSSFSGQPAQDSYADHGPASPSSQQDRPSMDSPYSPYRSPPNSGRPLLSVDPNFAARTKLQEPPRAAFAAPVSPARSSSGSTLIGSAPPSPAFAKSTMFNDAPSSPSRDNDRFAPSERADANDFWKRFSMVVKESENEKGGPKNADWLSNQNRKTKTYKRWIAIVGLLILAIIVAVVCWQTLLVDDDDNDKSAPTEHDFGLGQASISQHGQDRLVRRTALPRAFGAAAARAFHGHQHRA